MSFQERDGSVKSLLDILRTAQDGSAAAAPPPVPSLGSRHPELGADFPSSGPSRVPQQPPNLPSREQLDHLLSSLKQPAVASSSTSTPGSNSGSTPTTDVAEGQSAPKAPRTLIEPFGPITAQRQGPVRSPSRPRPQASRGGNDARPAPPPVPTLAPSTASIPALTYKPPPGSQRVPNKTSGAAVRASTASASGPKPSASASPRAEPAPSRKGKERARDAPRPEGFDTMPFSEALGWVSDLLGKEQFRVEVRKMKAEQDALERRMWAKGEKIRAEHERKVQTEKDLQLMQQSKGGSKADSTVHTNRTSLLTTPLTLTLPLALSISHAERYVSQINSFAQPLIPQGWPIKLENSLQDFYRQTCLPALDALALRHRARLRELGVPGLGASKGSTTSGSAQGTMSGTPSPAAVVAARDAERVRRIMDVIQGVLEE